MAFSTSPATGARATITLGEQTAYATAVAPTHGLDFLDESLSATETTLQSNAIRSDRGRHKLIRGDLDIGGDINFELAVSGFGMLFRHALGDYIKVSNADGGIRARVAASAVETLDAAEHANDGAEIMVLADEANTLFPLTGGTDEMTIVYRDTDNALAQTNDVEYEGMNVYARSYVSAAPVDPDTTYTGYVAESVVSIVVAPEYVDGVATNITFNDAGGVILYGDNRTSIRYFEATDLGAGNGTRLYLDPSQATVGDSTTYPAEDDGVIVKACISHVTGFGSPTGFSTGAFLYHQSDDYTAGGETVYTHHIERGRALPTAGLTVEVDRDAVIFVYSGIKVNTLQVDFQASSIVTGSFSLLGRAEHTSGSLVFDVIPGATELFIDDKYAVAFNTSGGTINLGERTGITYTTVEQDYNGTGNTRLSGIPSTGDAAIDRFSPAGTNVDPRTSTAISSPQVGNDTPLTTFESTVYIDGFYEEVLAGSITLNNNLNPDKKGMGSRFRFALIEQQAEVNANLTLEFDDGKNYIKFIEGTNFVTEFKCISEDATSEIGTTDVLSQAHFLMHKCKFDGETPNVEGVQYITHEAPITAVVDDELNTTDLIIILVNRESTDVEA